MPRHDQPIQDAADLPDPWDPSDFDDDSAIPDDPQSDPFRPPTIPTEVGCMHCGEEYESYLMEWRQEVVQGRVHGYWCCATPGCDGKGFGFDIFPTDPDYRGEDGQPMWEYVDDEDDELDDDFEDMEGEFDTMMIESKMEHSPETRDEPQSEIAGEEMDWQEQRDPFGRNSWQSE